MPECDDVFKVTGIAFGEDGGFENNLAAGFLDDLAHGLQC